VAGISIPAVRDSAHPIATIGAVVARGTDVAVGAFQPGAKIDSIASRAPAAMA
jgi:hypothetical protein